MFEKDGVVFESKEEYEVNAHELKKHKKKKRIRIFIISFLLLFIIYFFYACYRALIPVDYRIFTEKRTEFVEEKYMMDFSNVKLERYWTVSIAQDHDANLNFSGVESYSEFMENSFYGEILNSLYVGKKLDKGDVIEEMGEKNLVAEYKCKAGEIGFIIKFYEDGNSYKAEMESYYVVGG